MAIQRVPREGPIILPRPTRIIVPGPGKLGTSIVAPPPPPTFTGAGFRVRLARLKGLTDSKLLPWPLFFQIGSLDDWEVVADGAHEDYETIGAGEFSRKGGGRKLKEVEFHTMILFQDASWLTVHGVDPFYVRNQVEGLRDTRSPFELMVTLATGQIELKMDATIRHSGRVLKAGEPDARYIDVQMKEYRDPVVKQRRHTASKVKFPHRHKLTAADTLASLAKKYYRTSEGWRAIASANAIKSWGQSTPLYKSARFKVGDIVKIPAWDKPKKTRDIH